MVDMVYGLFRPMFDNQESYISYLYNKWVVVLLIAAMLEMYTMHRIDYVLSKEKKNTNKHNLKTIIINGEVNRYIFMRKKTKRCM